MATTLEIVKRDYREMEKRRIATKIAILEDSLIYMNLVKSYLESGINKEYSIDTYCKLQHEYSQLSRFASISDNLETNTLWENDRYIGIEYEYISDIDGLTYKGCKNFTDKEIYR